MGTQPLPKRGRVPQFSAHVYCGQTAARIKMPFGTEIGIGADKIVSDGDPAPLLKRAQSLPQFLAHFIVAKRLDASRCHLVWR